MLLKIALFGLVLFLIYLFFFKKSRKEDVQKYNAQKKALDGETMVECKACSTFVSYKDAIIQEGKFYCSKECTKVG